MKNLFKLFGIATLVVVIGFSMVTCSSDTTDKSGGGGDDTAPAPQTVMYSGTTADGSTYTLKITEGARYAAQVWDTYVLTVTKDGSTKTSSGTVTAVGSTLTLTPTGATIPFTVTVSTSGIIGMNGTITFDDNSEQPAPESLTPSNPSGNGEYIEVEKTFEFTDQQVYIFSQTGALEYDEEELDISGNVILYFIGYNTFFSERKCFGQIGKITNGKISLKFPVKISTEMLFKKGELYSGEAYLYLSVEGMPEKALYYSRKSSNDEYFYFVSQDTNDDAYHDGPFEKGWNFCSKRDTIQPDIQQHFWQLLNR